jgi:CRP-like cAMP-binding protein
MAVPKDTQLMHQSAPTPRAEKADYLSQWKAHVDLFQDRAWYLFPLPLNGATPATSDTPIATPAATPRPTIVPRPPPGPPPDHQRPRDHSPRLASSQEEPEPYFLTELPRSDVLPDYMTPSCNGGTSPRVAAAAIRLEQRERQVEVQHALEESVVVKQLRKIKWFASLPDGDLITLSKRGRHRFYPRYATIFREGNIGSAFYVVLQGQVLCTSLQKNINVTLGSGASFGETALVTQVRRELTAAAMEDSYLLQFRNPDIIGLDVQLGEIERHVIARILENVPFFKNLTKAQQEALASIMTVEYHSTNACIFKEGDAGSAMYVLIAGRVKMTKKLHMSSRGVQELTEYGANSERPWFGELSLWQSKPRAATATCCEPVQLLGIYSQHFSTFLEICPSFHQMFATSASAFSALNTLNSRSDTIGDVQNEARLLASQGALGLEAGQGFGSQLSALNALRNWARLTQAVLHWGSAMPGKNRRKARAKVSKALRASSIVQINRASFGGAFAERGSIRHRGSVAAGDEASQRLRERRSIILVENLGQDAEQPVFETTSAHPSSVKGPKKPADDDSYVQPTEKTFQRRQSRRNLGEELALLNTAPPLALAGPGSVLAAAGLA